MGHLEFGTVELYLVLQATQAICIKMQVGGKVTRMLREKKLSEPAEIRFVVGI